MDVFSIVSAIAAISLVLVTAVSYLGGSARLARDVQVYATMKDAATTDEESLRIDELRKRIFRRLKKPNVPAIIFKVVALLISFFFLGANLLLTYFYFTGSLESLGSIPWQIPLWVLSIYMSWTIDTKR